MFDNLSQRERYLAMAAGALLPLVVLLIAFMWLMNTLNGYDNDITSLNSQINQARIQQRKQTAAVRRLKTYKALSLSADPQRAIADYRDWLIGVADDVFGQHIPSYETPTEFVERSKLRDPAQRSRLPREIYHGCRIKFNVTAATLADLNEFLYQFYRAPILHRIKSLNVTPLAGNPGSNTAGIPSGRLGLSFEIEALSLSDAATDKSISSESYVALAHDREWYRKQIEHRNIFGLPNNAPQITSGNQSEFEERELAFNISARDDDANDQLTFELLETDVPGGTLTQRDPSSKSAQFSADPVEPGDYKIVVRVTDSGLPNKSTVKEIDLEVKPKRVVAEPEPKPPFFHGQETQVIAIVRENDGVDRAWINVRTLPDSLFKVATGESFEVDDREWTVTRIDSRSVTIASEGHEKTLRVGDKLGVVPRSGQYSSTQQTTSNDRRD